MLASATDSMHALVEALDGLERLGEEHPLLEVASARSSTGRRPAGTARAGPSTGRCACRPRSRRSPRRRACPARPSSIIWSTTANAGCSGHVAAVGLDGLLGRLADLRRQLHVQLVGELQHRAPGSRPATRPARSCEAGTPSVSIAMPSLMNVPITRRGEEAARVVDDDRRLLDLLGDVERAVERLVARSARP